MENKFEVRDMRIKEKFFVDDEYLNGYAKLCGINATGVYFTLCRHVNKKQECFPSKRHIAEKLGISERTVYSSIKLLEKWNIVKKESQGRRENGLFYNHIYTLLDKKQWKNKPQANGADGKLRHSPQANDDTNGRQLVPNKDTHKKDTHKKEVTKVTERSSDNQDNDKPVKEKKPIRQDISNCYDFLKAKLGATPDGTVADNRKYAKLLIDRLNKDYPSFNSEEQIQYLITAGLNDNFHAKNITSFKYIYYNINKIIQSVKPKNRVVDLTGL